MTDKVQKIREEVERIRNLHQIKYQNLDTNDNMCLVECGKRNLCNELLSFIDSLQEEPVSEDLEEATNNYVLNVRKGYPRVMDETDRYICNAFKAGAKWQKEQDQSTIELAEDHAMFAGMEKMREQMMKYAIPANILTNQYGNKYIQSWSGLKQYDKYKNGDKVKLIIIKQEEE